MPNPGDQHTIVKNPFQEVAPRMSEYTAQEIATLQNRLEKQLGPEYLSARSGPSGQKVHYIAAEKVIALANEVFGFNGWSSSIQTIQIDFVDEHPQTLKISIGLSVIVRVTLRDGSFHEDIGYGHIENCKGKAAAFEKAKKEGTTDALKRALRNFGNVLGNCIYDKAYVEKVSKIKVTPNRKFDERGLHRHADYAVKVEEPPAAPPVSAAAAVPKAESVSASTSAFAMDPFDEDLLGDFDEADFCVTEEGHPDEFAVPNPSVPSLPPPAQRFQQSRSVSPVRQIQPPQRPAGNANVPRPPQTPRPNGGVGGGRSYQAANQAANKPQPAGHYQAGNAAPRQNMNNGSNSGNGNGNNSKSVKEEEGTPWLSARAIAKVGEGDALAAVAPSVQAGHLFNPKAESPSIRKTPGVDHNSSKPIPRVLRPGGQQSSTPTPDRSLGHSTGAGSVAVITTGIGTAAAAGPGRANFNHSIPESARRIGAPSSTSSPLANRGQFRPPPMKRGPPGDAAATRQPLSEVTSNVPTEVGGIDYKRQKLA
ncbi:rad52 DNA repair protein radc [Grosmannia clavigera kw1407]|uniref:RAD52 homolog n=1 Tax=Grosmannia clavigera (strain kw1407 / UAMH 11150) TaxID=655863 RepID=F0XFN7_GROCL|nr:rad52 DNA repair protein radc [Grosmannia clavigera kw1407]EFX04603.1 rad52 DNA repair protein radc [Grosmannia clavigera kw1407]